MFQLLHAYLFSSVRGLTEGFYLLTGVTSEIWAGVRFCVTSKKYMKDNLFATGEQPEKCERGSNGSYQLSVS